MNIRDEHKTFKLPTAYALVQTKWPKVVV